MNFLVKSEGAFVLCLVTLDLVLILFFEGLKKFGLKKIFGFETVHI